VLSECVIKISPLAEQKPMVYRKNFVLDGVGRIVQENMPKYACWTVFFVGQNCAFSSIAQKIVTLHLGPEFSTPQDALFNMGSRATDFAKPYQSN
jgi:hypothetical protein